MNNRISILSIQLSGACVYFFFNTLFLPEGLLYTTFLTPLFFYNIAKSKWIKWFFIIAAAMAVYSVIHLLQGVNVLYYSRSFLLFLTVLVFCLWFVKYASENPPLEKIFTWILICNAAMIVVALAATKISFLKGYFWQVTQLSESLPLFPRLKMLTYEASYYSLLLVPVAFYALWAFLQKADKKNAGYLLLAVIPLLLSFSLGVIAGIVAAFIFCMAFASFTGYSNKRLLGITTAVCIFGGLLLLVLYKFFPGNPLIVRIKDIPTGADTSARGRTYEAFDIAWLIAKQKSVWLGVGLGQIKETGRAVIINYYKYSAIPSTVRIPNSVAELLAVYGITGVCIKFITVIFLFFKTKVIYNYYRLSLFLFVFIYQFTGSFLFNIAEYVIWILAFSPVLARFNLKEFNSRAE